MYKEGSKIMTDQVTYYHTLDKNLYSQTTHTNQYVNKETGATTNAIESVFN